MRKIVVPLLLTLTMALAACQGQDKPQTSSAQEEVSIQLNWLHSIAWASFYAAADEGYYRQQDLEVNVLEGGFDSDGNFIDPIQEVVSGNADFGIADGSVLLEAREQGQPVAAIATLYQRHPLVFTSLATNDIIRPQDMAGTTVHVSGNSRVLLQALLRAQNIDPETVNIVERTDFSTALLTNNTADVIDAWVINEVVPLQQDGVAINMILPSDYGIEFYPNLIFTTEDMIANHPDVVARFLNGTIKGMQFSVDKTETATDITLRYQTDGVKETELLAMQQSLPLMAPAGSNPGMMQPEIWEAMHQLLLEE